MPKKLTKAQIEQFHRDGFCFPIDVLSREQALECRHKLEDIEQRYPEEINATSRNNPHYVLPFLDELVHNDVILDAAEDLVGPDMLAWSTVLFIKEPYDPAFVSWHQDATYWGIEPHEGVSAWVALTPSTLQNGCMRMVPGSHRAPVRPHKDTFGDHNILTRGQAIEDIDESATIPVELQPGQMSLHHVRTIHGSLPNQSDERRIGFVIQAYIPPHARQTKGTDTAMLVRGRDSYGHFRLAKRPQRDMEPEARALRQQLNKRFAEILYDGATQRREY